MRTIEQIKNELNNLIKQQELNLKTLRDSHDELSKEMFKELVKFKSKVFNVDGVEYVELTSHTNGKDGAEVVVMWDGRNLDSATTITQSAKYEEDGSIYFDWDWYDNKYVMLGTQEQISKLKLLQERMQSSLVEHSSTHQYIKLLDNVEKMNELEKLPCIARIVFKGE